MIPKPIFISQLGEGKLFAMQHPLGGVYLHGAVTHLAETGITLIVSLLDEFDVSVLGLNEEEYICRLRNIESALKRASVMMSSTMGLSVQGTRHFTRRGRKTCRNL